MSESSSIAAKLAITKAKLSVLKAAFDAFNRFPAGSSKGGQFAPKGTAGGGAANKHPPNTFFESGWAGSGMWAKPKAPPPGAKPHPQTDDKGKQVHIHYPTPSSPANTWSNAKAVATFTPNGKTPDVLNGVPFKSWNPPKSGWANVSGTNEKLDLAHPFEPHPTKHTGAGVIIMEPDGRVWLTKPTNEFGGYKHTLPKGTTESGLTMQQNAIKEAFEETGLKVKIVGIAADVERDTSKARYYFARRVGGTPKDMGWESQALRLAPRKQALDLLNKPHDKNMLADVLGELGIHKAKDVKASGKAGAWQFQERWPAGSSLGGMWKAMGADGITAPPVIAGGMDGANSVYQKAANLAHDAVQKGDLTALSAVLNKYQGAADKFASGAKASSHVKWGAQVHQYVTQASADIKAKTSATATAEKLSGPQKLSAMTQIGAKPGGSNPGGMYTDAQGKWLVKGSNAGDATDRSKNEVLASKLMAAVGVGAPEMKLVDLEGKHGTGIGVASKWVDGAHHLDIKNAAHLAAAQSDFAVHAWLANYDALGMTMDNTVIKDGKAVNIDPGGALLYRAQGAPKGDAFGNKADEWTTMRDVTKNPNGAKVYGQMSASQLTASAEKLKAIDDATIGKLVQTYGPGTAYEQGLLTSKLIARKADILARVAALTPAPVATPKPAPASAPKPVTPAPAPAAKVNERVYHHTGEGHNKFWAISVHGNTVVTRYGKIGSEGSVSVKTFKTGDAAFDGAMKLRAEKLNKGYEFKATQLAHPKAVAAAGTPAPTPAPTAAPAAQKPVRVKHEPASPPKAADNEIKKPINWPFPGKADFYTNLTAEAEKHHAAGNLASLLAMKYKGAGVLVWPSSTANGKLMEDYHTKLVADLQAKKAVGTMAAVNAAQAAVNTPVAGAPAPKHTMQGGTSAMPDFAKFKLPATNSNAPSHNAKVDKISELAAKGDVKGLISLNYGTNNYAKKQVQLANDALKALGSEHSVAMGQKQNAHPALLAGYTPTQVQQAAAIAKQPVPDAHPATKGKPDMSKLDTSKVSMPPKPHFDKSSKAHVNESNNKLAAEIAAKFHSGDYTALLGMQFQELDKETGKAGALKHISDHPAKDLKAFYDATLTVMREAAYPPKPLKVFASSHASTVKSIAAAFPSKAFGTTVDKVASNEKVGFWVALGKVDAVKSITPGKTVNVSEADSAKAFTDYQNKITPLAKAFINGIQSSGSYNDLFRDGVKTVPKGKPGAGHTLEEVAKAAEAYAQPKPAGTRITRWQHMSADMIKKLESAGPGTVLQATGSMCCSKSDTATKGFGPHKITIVYADGAKAVDSFGSGSYSSEQEITTLPNSRFVVLKVGKQSNGNSDVMLLMLPPDLGIKKPKP